MPLLHHIKKEAFEVLVWDSKEALAFFEEKLIIEAALRKEISNYKPQRLREWLTTRYLIRAVLKVKAPIYKDSYGKPQVKNSKLHLSLSHSGTKAAVILSRHRVGIDIQKEVDRIGLIQKKFVSSDELSYIDPSQEMAYNHILWGAKESMYKAYGKKELDFKKHMYVYPFVLFGTKTMEFEGWVRKNLISESYSLYFEMVSDYYLIYCIEHEEN